MYRINGVFVDNALREKAWALLAQHLSVETLERMTTEIGLSQVIEHSRMLLDGIVRGRSVVDVNR